MLNSGIARNAYVTDVPVIYISIRVVCSSHESVFYVEIPLFLNQNSRAYQIRKDNTLQNTPFTSQIIALIYEISGHLCCQTRQLFVESMQFYAII